jgi:hypothetical protein
MNGQRLVSHDEAERSLRRFGYSPEKIADVLGDLPDPFDPERDGGVLFKHGISTARLMERMGGSL